MDVTFSQVGSEAGGDGSVWVCVWVGESELCSSIQGIGVTGGEVEGKGAHAER